MWYVIQTTTGQEEILVEMMRKILSKELYRDCFYIKRECAIKQEVAGRSAKGVVSRLCLYRHRFSQRIIL